jgi:23S rRNA pseudouridine2605 synthase
MTRSSTNKPPAALRAQTEARPGAGAAKPEGSIPDDAKPERIAKVMARAGLCSRRDAEKWIEAGRVKVNGKLIVSQP